MQCGRGGSGLYFGQDCVFFVFFVFGLEWTDAVGMAEVFHEDGG